MSPVAVFWVKRMTYAAVTGLVVWGFTAWVGLHPQPALIVAAAGAQFVIYWSVADVAARIEVVDWLRPHRGPPPRYGLDPMFSRLSQNFSGDSDLRYVARQVHAILVRVVDDRLLATYGIDRAHDPDRARAVLGETIASYVQDPPRVRHVDAGYLGKLLSGIEAL